MGILERFSTIMKSNINALLDKAEDPEKMIDQTLLDLREDLAKVKAETASVMASQTAIQRDIDACQARIDKYQNAAVNALKANQEDDARTLLERKKSEEEALAAHKQNFEVVSKNAENLREMYNKLSNDISNLETKKAAIKAKVATAKAQKRVNDITEKTSDVSDSMEAFSRMEKKADAMLDQAMAEAELNKHASGDLLDKYSSGSADVDAELADLKKSLGME